MNVAYFRYGAVAQPKHTHNFEGGEVVKNIPATCEADGEKTMRCASSTCMDVQVTVLPKLGHKYSEWKVTKEATVTETGLEERVCDNCKKAETREIEKLKEEEPVIPCEHVYIETGRTDATCETDGSKTEVCDLCGDEKTTAIPKLGHTWQEIEIDDETKTICSVCGKEKTE